MQVQNYGAVFTKRWVVEAMLDLSGYTADVDLAEKLAIEPACGGGAFLLPMVERLSASMKAHGRSLREAEGAIQASDLQANHVSETQELVAELLVIEGWPAKEAGSAAAAWLRHDDFLLVHHAPEADFVVGNPPYIRSEDMRPELRARYLVACKTMTPGADIFVGFIEKGLVSLRPGGVLCFIVADRWQHNAYGRKLRRMVVDGYAVEAMFEMHGVDAFAEDVSAYPAITQIRRSPQGRVAYATARPKFGDESARKLVAWAGNGRSRQSSAEDYTAAKLPEWFATDDVWPSGSPPRLAAIEEIEDRCPPLEDAETGTRVGIGIATGADQVFVTANADAVEPDRMLPLVLTSHIRSGEVDWSPAAWLVNPWDGNGRLVDLDAYPRLRAYLEEHHDGLSNRHVAQRAAADWYRTIDKVQRGLAEKPKLLLQDMKTTIQPVYDEGRYPHHNLYWVTSDTWDLPVLGGLLLSGVAQMFVEAYGVKMRGGTLRFQAQYLRKIRVPVHRAIGAPLRKRLAGAFVSRDTRAATEAALEAYGLDLLPD